MAAHAPWTAFARFPVWMWRNQEMRGFVDWLRDHNADVGAGGVSRSGLPGTYPFGL